MFHTANYNIPFWELPHYAMDRQIISLSAAGCEDDFIWFGAQPMRQLPPRFRQGVPDILGGQVRGRWILKLLS